MSDRITITVTCETVNEDGIHIEEATAFVEGMGVRGVVTVPSLGDRSRAMAEAARKACLRHDTKEPHAYSPQTIAAKDADEIDPRWRREIEDYGPQGALGGKAVR